MHESSIGPSARSAHCDNPKGQNKEKRPFTALQAAVIGVFLGMIYFGVSAYTAKTMAANGSCTAAEYSVQP